jgi:hypothetical protein
VNVNPRRPLAKQRPEDDPLTALRLRLLANGFTPLPNYDKVCLEWNWPRLVVDAAKIISWKGSRARKRLATGLRVENGLCVPDVDSTDPRLLEGFRADLADVNPAVSTQALERHGGAGGKFALFCRRPEDAAIQGIISLEDFYKRPTEAYYRIQSRKWVRPEDLDKATEERAEHRLEVFAGAKGGRQFGAFGPHSHDAAGQVLREYRWLGRSPADVPLKELPVLTKVEVFTLVDAFDDRAAALGYVPVPHTTQGETVPSFVYDLTYEMDFDGNSLDELATLYYAARNSDKFSNRISSRFLGHGTNPNKCIVGWSGRHDCVCVHNFETGITHLPADHKPIEDGMIADIMKLIASRVGVRP